MDSFKALQIEGPGDQFVSGFVHLNESWPDFCNVTKCTDYSRVVDIGTA
jgi:hypothetical protein